MPKLTPEDWMASLENLPKFCWHNGPIANAPSYPPPASPGPELSQLRQRYLQLEAERDRLEAEVRRLSERVAALEPLAADEPVEEASTHPNSICIGSLRKVRGEFRMINVSSPSTAAPIPARALSGRRVSIGLRTEP